MSQILAGFLSKLARDYIFSAKLIIMVALTLLVNAFYLTSNSLFERLEYLSLDYRFKVRGRQFNHPKLIMIEIAEDSIGLIGRWPWDRKWHASIVQALKDFGAKTVAFDVLFPDPQDEKTDNLFAKAIEKAGNVYLPVSFDKLDGDVGSHVVSPLEKFSEGARGLGHITIVNDPDGMLRRIKPRIRYEGRSFLQLGMMMALHYFGADPDKVEFFEDRIEIPVAGNPNIVMPLTDKGNFLINWTGLWAESFHHVSFKDVVVSYMQHLRGEETRIDVEIFEDSLCLIGSSAAGLFDIRSMPMEPSYPGMGVNTTVLNSIIEQKFLSTVSTGWNVGIICLLGLITLLVMHKSNSFQSIFTVFLLIVIYTATVCLMFVLGGIIVTLVYPLILMVMGYIGLTAFQQIVISIEKKRLMKLATTDPLTGLFNIAHFKRLLGAELSSIKLRTNKNICVVMVDGDHFKNVNDTYGHAAGDDVLRGIADILKNNCRALDVAARYGGEEFIIMLPGATVEAAVKVADKMRSGLEERKFELKNDGTFQKFTASFGVSSLQPGETMESLMKRADAALYEAKEGGRNCVITAR